MVDSEGFEGASIGASTKYPQKADGQNQVACREQGSYINLRGNGDHQGKSERAASEGLLRQSFERTASAARSATGGSRAPTENATKKVRHMTDILYTQPPVEKNDIPALDYA